MQQQYELNHGIDRGRLWRLTRADAPAPRTADMSGLTDEQLAAELGSGNFWRRQTARRLLAERQAIGAADNIRRLVSPTHPPATEINALYTLAGLGQSTPADVLAAMSSSHPEVRINGLHLAEPDLDREPVLVAALALAADDDPTVSLQAALSLGQKRASRAVSALAALARARGNVPWMETAILSSSGGCGAKVLEKLLRSDEPIGEPVVWSVLCAP